MSLGLVNPFQNRISFKIGLKPPKVGVYHYYFEPPCYPQCYSIDIPEHLRPKAKYLKPDAIPTINTVVVGLGADMKTTPVSKREDRMVSVII